MPTEHALPPTFAAPALVQLPHLEEQTEDQRRGAACCWCGNGLSAESAVDLGERRYRSYSAFPRGCRCCTSVAANRALQDHAPLCEQCVDDGSKCETGMALYRLIRDSRQPVGGRR